MLFSKHTLQEKNIRDEYIATK